MATFQTLYRFKTAHASLPFAEALAQLEKDSELAAGTLAPESFDYGNQKEVKKAEDTAGATPVAALGARRKEFTVTLEAPDWISSLPELAQTAIKSLISDFVKSRYVENYAEIGQHDWAFIEAELAKSPRAGGGVKLTIEDSVWALASKSFEAYILEVVGNPGAAKRLAAIMSGKFSQTVIQKQANEFTEEIIGKLSGRLDAWARWASENDTDNADDFALVYQFVDQRMNKHLKLLKDDSVPLTDII